MRVVSLVPSLTETLFAMGLGVDEVVGRTPWCVEPRGKVEDVPVVGGSKTPSVSRVLRAAPDLVVMDREENPQGAWRDIEEAGVETLVSEVRRASDVPPLLARLGERVGRAAAGRTMAADTERAIEAAEAARAEGPRAALLIWRDPLMALGPGRYGGDMARLAGYEVVDPEPGTHYPEVTPDSLGRAGAETLLLLSEPHPFTEAEGREIAAAVEAAGHPRPRTMLVDGQALTWFGARTASALQALAITAPQD